MRKNLDELIDKDDTTWNMVQEWARKSNRKNEILPPNSTNAKNILTYLQISTKSVIGTITYKTGGILIDNKWLRILGSGHELFFRDIVSWNEIGGDGKGTKLKGCLFVADDVVGGFFALNGGAFQGEIGSVFYFAPDTLGWEDLEMSYSDFIHWALVGDVGKFYASFRWNGWNKEVVNVGCDKGILIYPFLWAEGPELINRVRKIVPIDELWNINLLNREKFLDVK